MTAVLEPAVPGPIGLQGPQGPAGEDGTDGAMGPPGGNYLHSQAVAASTWGPIVHGLGFYPNVSVIDSAGTEVEGTVTHNSINSLTVTFSVPFSGTATLS